MNRRKKLKQIIKRKDARGKAAQNSSKPKYISKADRAKTEAADSDVTLSVEIAPE